VGTGSVLSYGIVGLGFLLAGFAFRLLSREQAKKVPSVQIIRAIYVFEVFCAALILAGLANEFMKNELKWTNDALSAKVFSLTNELTVAHTENTRLSAKADASDQLTKENSTLKAELATAAKRMEELSTQIDGLAKSRVQQKWLKIIGLDGLPGVPVRIVAWVNDVAYSYPNSVTWAEAGPGISSATYPLDIGALSYHVRFQVTALINGDAVDFLSQTVLNIDNSGEQEYSVFGVDRNSFGSVRGVGTIHTGGGADTIKRPDNLRAVVRFVIATN
jgi:hypothetical protein